MRSDIVKWQYMLPDGTLSIITIDYVSIRFDGVVYILPKPNRHHNVIRMINLNYGVRLYGPHEEGFVDCLGNFLNRREAYKLASENGQLVGRSGSEFYQGNELYSEDLW